MIISNCFLSTRLSSVTMLYFVTLTRAYLRNIDTEAGWLSNNSYTLVLQEEQHKSGHAPPVASEVLKAPFFQSQV